MTVLRSLACSLAGLLACDADAPSRGAPPPPGATGEVSDPAPPMVAGLVKRGADADWYPGDRRGEPNACLLIDNGDTAVARLRLPDQSVFEVAPKTRQRLCTFTGELVFSVPVGAAWVELAPSLGADRLTVYDPGGLWDYAILERSYSTVGVGGGEDRRDERVGALVFDTAPVDFAFEPLPESFEAEAPVAEVVSVRARRQLDHLGDPHADRRVRPLGGGDFVAVVSGPGLLAVQGRVPGERTTLVVDNPGRGELALSIDGVEIGGVPERTWSRVVLPAGRHALAATRAGKPVGTAEARELAAGARHLWEPTGKQRYAVERGDYGQPLIPSLGAGVATPVDDAGFFAITTDFVLEPFPEAITTPYGLGSQRTRLVRR